MSRLSRKKRIDDLGIKSSGGMLDLFDNAIKEIHRINDKEFDYLLSKMTDDEMDLLVNEKISFSEKRTLLTIIDKYLKEMI